MAPVAVRTLSSPVAAFVRSQQAGGDPLSKAVLDPEGFLLPHVRTFNSLLNATSKVYSYRWDEAIRHSRKDASAMHLDAYLRALEQERLMPLTGWQWDIEADPDENDLVNPKDPRSVDREDLRKMLKVVAKRTPELIDLRRYLGLSCWFGRYGAQILHKRENVCGHMRWVVGAHLPVDGDKIQFGWDDTPAIMVRPGETAGWPQEDLSYFDGSSLLALLRRPAVRRRFVVSKFFIEDADYFDPTGAGRVRGIGYRDFCHWASWLRNEMLAWLTDFMEKVGNLGIVVFYYQDGNPKAKADAERSAANASGRNALAVPVPAGADKKTSGVELLPANVAGAQFLKEIIADQFERYIERLIVGQSMSSGSDKGDGLGGTGRADFAKDTKFHLLRWDAEKQAECLTREFLKPLQELNAPDSPWRYQWVYKLPDPSADKKLEAVSKAVSLPGKRLAFKAEEVRSLVGLTKPDDGDEIVGGDDPQQPPGGMPNGPQPQAGNPSPNPLPQGGPGGDALPRPDGNGGSGGAGAGAAEPRGQAGQPGIGGGSGGQPVSGVTGQGAELPHQPTPGMGELVAAMAQLAEAGDFDGVDELAEIGADPEGLASLLEDLQGADDPHQTGTVAYQWTAAQTRGGGVKAVWGGAGSRAPLYGERARKALESQGKPEAERGSPTKRSLIEQKAAAEPGRQESRATWQKAAADPASVRPEELAGLADQMKRLTRDEIREMNRAIGAKLGGLKADLVQRLIDHVRTGREQAGGEPEPAPTPAKPDVPLLKEKGRKPRGPNRGNSLASIIARRGGIKGDGFELKRFFSSMKDAIANGVPMSVFRKDGFGLDQMADELMSSGKIQVPDGVDPSEHLLHLLQTGAMTAEQDAAANYSKAEEEYARAQQEAYDARIEREAIAERAGRGESEADREEEIGGGADGLEGTAGDAGGFDFDFGANEPAAGGVTATDPFDQRNNDAPFRDSFLGSDRQLDIFGGGTRAPKPAKPAVQPSLIPKDAEIRDNTQRAEEAFGKMKAAAQAADAEPPKPATAPSPAAQPAPTPSRVARLTAQHNNAKNAITEQIAAVPAEVNALTRAELKELAAGVGISVVSGSRADLASRVIERIQDRANAALKNSMIEKSIEQIKKPKSQRDKPATNPPTAEAPAVRVISAASMDPNRWDSSSTHATQREALAAGGDAVVNIGGKWHSLKERPISAAKPAQQPTAPAGDFASSALDAARTAHAAGKTFAGNKVFIADAYAEARKKSPSLTMDEFKRQLVEANQSGKVRLQLADLGFLRADTDPDAVRNSETNHLNATWHLIELPDAR